MSEEELMSMFEKDIFPYENFIKHYKIVEFENIIKRIVTEHKIALAELEAKVYTYEKVIANSNFAPIANSNFAPFVRWHTVDELVNSNKESK